MLLRFIVQKKTELLDFPDIFVCFIDFSVGLFLNVFKFNVKTAIVYRLVVIVGVVALCSLA